jgi:uroporphyrinogen-III synthase
MAVQYFAQGLELCGPELAEEVRGIPVAAIGPATAERAREIGLEPSLVSKGHLVDVAEDQAGASALPL